MPSEGERRREEGMERVRHRSDPWWTWALFLLNATPANWMGRPEQAYRPVLERIGHPELYGINYRVMGALWMHTVRMGLFEKTAILQNNLENPKNHGSTNLVYTRTSFRPQLGLRSDMPLPPAPPQEPRIPFWGDDNAGSHRQGQS